MTDAGNVIHNAGHGVVVKLSRIEFFQKFSLPSLNDISISYVTYVCNLKMVNIFDISVFLIYLGYILVLVEQLNRDGIVVVMANKATLEVLCGS